MERVMSQLAEQFCLRNDVDVHLILYGRAPVVFYKVPELLKVHHPESGFNNSFRNYYTLKRMFFLRKTIWKIRPTTILSFGEYWNSFVLLSLVFLKYPVFISDRCRPDKDLGGIHQGLRRILYPKASGIIVQTTKAKEIYKSAFRYSNIRVIGNPIARIGFGNSMEKENIILSVGRLIPSKNHGKLIDSFIRMNIPGWKLVIVGGNALKMNLLEELQQKVKGLMAENKIILTGNTSDVEHYYKISRIFVLTSESEGFPNVIGEAMSAGLPVVSFDCIAGPAEMITDGKDGFLIPVNDFKLLEEKLAMLINDPGLREKIGEEAKRSIARFSIKEISEEYFDFITSES